MARQLPNNGHILGVDYGFVRTGLALAGAIARLPEPYTVVNSAEAIQKIKDLIGAEDIQLIVVGLPRSLEGNETAQSKSIRRFADELRRAVDPEVCFADETLSSARAERYLKDHKSAAGEVDSIAACFILEEFFHEAGN